MKKTWKKGDKFKVIEDYVGYKRFTRFNSDIITAWKKPSVTGYDFIDKDHGYCWKIGTQVIPYIEEKEELFTRSIIIKQDKKLKEVEETTKFDEGKPDFTQIPQEALLEVAKSFTYGATKYGEFNYSLGTNYRRYVAASQRHINQWLRGEDLDESGTNHLSNAIASLMMVLDNQLTGKGKDDRNKVYKNK